MKKTAVKVNYLLSVVLCICSQVAAQSISPDVQDSSQWTVINRSVRSSNEDGKKAVQFSEAANEGYMILKDGEFSNGVIEFDVKGKNIVQQSFVGVVFHGIDERTYDAVYFRPFNFANADTARRRRAVQYVSMPAYPWEKLREMFPGQYENKVDPVPDPDGWFHVKLVVDGRKVSVFVNNAGEPSLAVEKLTATTKGGIALWVGNNSGGSFANLTVSPLSVGVAVPNSDQKVSYGNNPLAGKYFDVGGAKIYFEIYGQGKPLVLLHGGVYGYIDEFEPFIKRLSESYQVICIATRGHGKSEMGCEVFTYKQRAEDAYKVIRGITRDSVIVLGFSDGGYSGLKLASLYPALVRKLVVIGAGDFPKNNTRQKFNYTAESLLKNDSAFFAGRLALMPEPKRWNEGLAKLSKLYNEDYMSTETFEKIKCPVLVMSGDRDDYQSVEAVVKCARAIPNATLSIIPGCRHVVFFCNFPAVWESIKPFLKD